ncbi:hypothetical protein [Acinetobacter bereziniae]|uniref:hypothetical protein n=1 Tax=Acinetobacter bereziniae TaxID=106648 RepID=UPI0018FF2365|nr:hypothetical protein [Acinetobacter bereziniae]MBJ9905358.1 hypothetical protein [Acinetobacter bereziniae]MCU4317905.1 hypothetical protein [Acinetobacter bereziniae]MCU4600144.1 hypothetical protein [Acinetobacter bereziniae]
MSFVTESEVEQALGDTWSNQSESDKAQLLKKSRAYLIARNVKDYENVVDVPQDLKDASFEIIKGIIDKKLYIDKDQELKSKRVKADSVESEKVYQDGSKSINATEQYIWDLIKPYTKKSRVQMVRRL